MQNSLKTLFLILGVIFFSSTVWAQKNNVIQAALEFQKQERYSGGKNPAAERKAILAAKHYIDLAAAHPQTQTDQKMFWYKGNIYFALAVLKIQDASISNLSFYDILDMSLESWERGMHAGKKYIPEIKYSVEKNGSYFMTLAGYFWERQEYAASAEYYKLSAAVMNSTGILNTAAIYNAGLGFQQAGDYRQAAEMFDNLVQLNYKVGEMANLAMNAYKMAGETHNAIAVLNSAIALQPQNAQLHFSVGTLYMELKRHQEAETALTRAVQMNPGLTNAQYQLGAHQYNWALELTNQSQSYPAGYPQQQQLKSQADAKMYAAIQSLEVYIQSQPNDKNVLAILAYACKTLGYHQRAAAYQSRADAL